MGLAHPFGYSDTKSAMESTSVEWSDERDEESRYYSGSFVNKQNIKIVAYKWMKSEESEFRGVIVLAHGVAVYAPFSFMRAQDDGRKTR